MQEMLLLLRKRKGYTQKSLADYLDLSHSHYSKKERGLHEFTLSEMFALSQLFELPIDQIFSPRNRDSDKNT